MHQQSQNPLPVSSVFFVVLIVVSLVLKFFTKGLLSNAAILVGLLAGYALAFALGMVNFGAVGNAAWITSIQPLPYGFEFSLGAVIAVTLVSIVSAIETVGDASATTKAGANREATDKEIAGATYADGLGTAVAGVFGGGASKVSVSMGSLLREKL